MTETTSPRILSAAPTLVEELSADLDPVAAFRQLNHLPFPVLLDSSLGHPELGNLSVVAADPFDHRLVSTATVADLEELNELWQRFQTESLAGLPSFQGGIINLCSYSLNSCLENTPRIPNEFGVPDLFYGLYDTVLLFDHATGRNWIVSHGFPETEPVARRARAEARLRVIRDQLQRTPPAANNRQVPGDPLAPLDRAGIRGCYPSSISRKVFSNFTRDQYIAAVQQGIDYIHAGDIFQVNLSQRLLCQQTATSWGIYDQLRARNPATFSAFLDLGDQQILSSSPERLLRIQPDGSVETRPIKGTRQRSCYPEANLFSAEGLVTSEKDRAENVMIVDLLRNDLSRFCLDDSIQVTQLCGIENYEFVQHLVSVVRGQLRDGIGIPNLLQSIFPGGSITGAPKVRAMEIIAEIEKVSRGAYCGSLGYFGFNGAVDQNILIRTMTAARGWLQIPVGGGIVAQSDPVSEYEETVHKAHGMLRCLL